MNNHEEWGKNECSLYSTVASNAPKKRKAAVK